MIITIVNLIIASSTIYAVGDTYYEHLDYLFLSKAIAVSMVGIFVGYIIRDVYYVGSLTAGWNSMTHGNLIRFWSQPIVGFSTAALIYGVRHLFGRLKHAEDENSWLKKENAGLKERNSALREALRGSTTHQPD